MNTSIYQLEGSSWIKNPKSDLYDDTKANLVLCFGSKSKLQSETLFPALKSRFGEADIALCSTAGEIYNDSVLDQSCVVTAIHFDKTTIKATSINSKDFPNSFAAAIGLAKKLPQEGLVYIMILSDGSLVNGSELVKGLKNQTGNEVLITGGLAGDGANFQSTLVGLNTHAKEGEIIAIGFYGKSLTVTHGSQGGWEIFGLEKTVSNSSSNILFELEEENALDLYKKYLGEEANKLPGSALLFPLSVIIPGANKPIVRTILSINEEDKSMTFAGDIPVGSKVRFMKANFEKLTHAASLAAQHTKPRPEAKPDFSLLVSCVGRKLVLGSKIDEEVKAVSENFEGKTLLSGFYSYGEISPFNEGGSCQLHNQTMTITSFFEI